MSTKQEINQHEILVSILTCTFNPRADYLQRVVDAVGSQTLETAQWEYIIVNNASSNFPSIDFSGITNFTIIQEDKPGKSNALLTGMRLCRGRMIVIVDDDNLLPPNYLVTAWKIYCEMPMLGVWGGQINPEFETQPSAELEAYLHLLTLYKVERAIWSNIHTNPVPAGAGMCLRKEVALKLQVNADTNGIFHSLGRTGIAMPGIDDWETAMAACDLGLGMGKFPSLELTHLIPSRRVEKAYLLTLQENAMFSYQTYVRTRPELHSQQIFAPSLFSRLINWFRDYKFPQTDRLFRRAARRGLRRANAQRII